MRRRIVECVANFSEGRRSNVIDAIAATVKRHPGACLLDRTSDPDHNRSVLTFAGKPEAVLAAAVDAVAVAAELIDLTKHNGVHPRLGAADVVPFVPIEGVTLAECVELALRAGEAIWRTVGVPVYFYEAAARCPERSRLEKVRRGGFEGIRERSSVGPEWRPDIGGPELHPTAGATIVGARKVLIAWNVNLEGGDLDDARAIARTIRASSGGLPCVKALGLPLKTRGQTQVSVNLTDFAVTPLHVVYEAIIAEAERRKIRVVGSEIIGLIPRGALEAAAERYFRFENLRRDRVLEQRIGDLLPAALDEWLDLGTSAALAILAAAIGLRLSGKEVFAEAKAFLASASSLSAEAVGVCARTLLRELQQLPHSADASAAVELARAAVAAAEAQLK